MLNQSLFVWLNNLAGRWPLFDHLVKFFAVYSGIVLILALVALYVFERNRQHFLMLAYGIFAGAVARVGVTEVIRLVYPHLRPFDVMSVHQLIAESASSFPSGHAMFFFALSAVVYYYNKRLGLVFFVTSILMGLARVIAGVHWPADILGGAIFGILTAWAVLACSRRLTHLLIKP